MVKPVKLLFILCIVFYSCEYLYAPERIIVAIVKTRDNDSYNKAITGFSDFFAEKNIAIWSSIHDLNGKKENSNSVYKQLQNSRPDVILTLGTLASQTATEEINDIPIISCIVMKSFFANRRQNSSGVAIDIPVEHKFDMLEKIIPGKKRVGLIYSRKNKELAEKYLAVSKKKNFILISRETLSEKEIPEIFKDLHWRIDALLMAPDPLAYTTHSIKYIVIACLKNRIPLIGLSTPYTGSGALFSLDSDCEEMGHQAGEMALKVIMNTDIGSIPIALPRKLILSINLFTAKQIGLNVPDEVIRQADKIFKK
ncbi:ABC transporter substrate-binding protein [Elusimicrobiota bacterium]